MIKYKAGDLFSEDVEALVNSVNCVGVMGRGIALQFKNLFPDNFKEYAKACKQQEVQPGRMFVFETKQLANPLYIINFPTKRHWRGKSRMEDIESGLKSLVSEIRERNIQSIAIPSLGSDLGGLRWSDVRPLIDTTLRELDDVDVFVFAPGSAPSDGRPNRSKNVPKMTPARAALVSLMNRYYLGLLEPFINLLGVHKLMYFLQCAGEPLKLNFQKGTYGPYAENMRHVLRSVEGHLISGYQDGGDAPFKVLKLVPGAIKDAEAYLQNQPETMQRLERVSDLVSGFDLELLATVHWVVNENSSAADDEIITLTHAWNQRKKMFSERQIHIAIKTLRDKGWINAPSGSK